jgi:hypothetical protein
MLFVSVAALCCQAAAADSFSDERHLSASPDVSAAGLAWRGHLRGIIGVDIPLIEGTDAPVEVRLPVMVELHNIVDNVTPNNYWRGLLGIEVAHVFGGVAAAGDLRLAFQIAHESDHETVDLVRYFGQPVVDNSAPVGFYQFNSVALRGDWAFVAGGQRLVVSATARLHLLSCNVNLVECASGSGGWGSPAFEGIAELVWEGWKQPPASGRWQPFGSLFADWLAPNGLVREEHRAVANAGAWVRTATRGEFALFLVGWLGNDVGYLRDQRVTELGLGFRWTP